MIKLCLGVILLAINGPFRASARAVMEYDQKQEGDVNVQLDLKDVQILAIVDTDLFQDYLNYDYAYDESDFTIKPISKPITSTTTTTPTIMNSTLAANSTTLLSLNSTTSTERSSVTPSLVSTSPSLNFTTTNAILEISNVTDSTSIFHENVNTTTTSFVQTEMPMNTKENNYEISTIPSSSSKHLNGRKRQSSLMCRLRLLPDRNERCKRRRTSMLHNIKRNVNN